MAREVGIATVFQEVMIAEKASVVDNLFVGSDSFWYKNFTQREKVLKAQRTYGRSCRRIYRSIYSSIQFIITH